MDKREFRMYVTDALRYVSDCPVVQILDSCYLELLRTPTEYHEPYEEVEKSIVVVGSSKHKRFLEN